MKRCVCNESEQWMASTFRLTETFPLPSRPCVINCPFVNGDCVAERKQAVAKLFPREQCGQVGEGCPRGHFVWPSWLKIASLKGLRKIRSPWQRPTQPSGGGDVLSPPQAYRLLNTAALLLGGTWKRGL